MLSAQSRADLHLHSNASDGIRTPAEIVEIALAAGVEVIALTDHDTMRNTIVLNQRARAAGITTLSGMEVSAVFQRQVIHLLAYGLDPDSPKVRWYENFHQDSAQRQALKTIAAFRLRGAAVDEADYNQYIYDFHRGSWKLFAYLQDRGCITDMADYRSKTANGLIQEAIYLRSDEIIAMIHEAGGRAVIAHPFDYSVPEPAALLDALREQGLDGVEGYHSHHTPRQARELVSYARRHGLLITGGSDDHGHLPGRSLGKPEITLAQLNLSGLLALPPVR